jgi:hypothetical protein
MPDNPMDWLDLCQCVDDVVDIADDAAEAFKAAKETTGIPEVQRLTNQAMARVRTFADTLAQDDIEDGKRELLRQLHGHLVGSRLVAGAVIRGAIYELEQPRDEKPTYHGPKSP